MLLQKGLGGEKAKGPFPQWLSNSNCQPLKDAGLIVFIKNGKTRLSAAFYRVSLSFWILPSDQEQGVYSEFGVNNLPEAAPL